jgi:DNA-binding Lrp family transcriptional regulator
MALLGTHIRFALDIKDSFDVKNIDKYISGTVYPDSRYLTKIDRKITHWTDVYDENFCKNDDFKKGWITHLIYDRIQADIFKEIFPELFDKFGNEKLVISPENWVIRSSLKMFQDLDDISKFEIKNYLKCLEYSETPNNEKSELTKDKKDIQILQIIGDNAGNSLVEISKKLKISPDSVAYRIKNLIDIGVIIKFIPSIDYDKIGYTLYCALVNINILTSEKESKLKEYIYSDKNIIWGVKTIGKYNLIIYYLTKDINETQKSIIRLRQCFPKDIKEYEILIGYNVQKYSYFPEGLII